MHLMYLEENGQRKYTLKKVLGRGIPGFGLLSSIDNLQMERSPNQLTPAGSRQTMFIRYNIRSRQEHQCKEAVD